MKEEPGTGVPCPYFTVGETEAQEVSPGLFHPSRPPFAGLASSWSRRSLVSLRFTHPFPLGLATLGGMMQGKLDQKSPLCEEGN